MHQNSKTPSETAKLRKYSDLPWMKLPAAMIHIRFWMLLPCRHARGAVGIRQASYFIAHYVGMNILLNLLNFSPTFLTILFDSHSPAGRPMNSGLTPTDASGWQLMLVLTAWGVWKIRSNPSEPVISNGTAVCQHLALDSLGGSSVEPSTCRIRHLTQQYTYSNG